MSLEISNSELAKYQDDSDVLKATFEQIQKDLGQYGLEAPIDIEGDTPFLKIFNNLRPVVEYLIEKDTPKLAQVIYRMDLNESKVAEALDNQSKENPVDALTLLIVEREMMKVVLRRKYS